MRGTIACRTCFSKGAPPRPHKGGPYNRLVLVIGSSEHISFHSTHFRVDLSYAQNSRQNITDMRASKCACHTDMTGF